MTVKAMTPKHAAKVFKREKAENEKRAPRLAEAKRVLLEHFESTETFEFDGIGLAVDTSSRLDTTRVKVFLGDKVGDFMRPVVSRTLSVLEAG